MNEVLLHECEGAFFMAEAWLRNKLILCFCQ